MILHVEYLAQLRDAAGREREEVSFEADPSLTDLLGEIAGRHGDAMRQLLFDAEGRPRASTLAFANGRHLPVGEASTLPDGTEVVLTTPVSGG